MQISETDRDHVKVVSLSGRLDSLSSPDAEKRLLNLVEAGARKMVLDCQGLEYISSAGLRVLLTLAKHLGAVQGNLLLAAPADQVREVLDIAGFADILPVCASVDEAVKLCA
ncbi:MAG: STAS domain-containing protein [Kiritimatiellia bacterium]|nr:STAS domain-containing protein [Lentisphaerota bacterium]